MDKRVVRKEESNPSNLSSSSIRSSPEKLGNKLSNLGLKFKLKKKSDSDSESMDGGKKKAQKKVKSGKTLTKGGDEVSGSMEQLEGGKVKGKSSIGHKLNFSKLSGKLTGSKKDSPPKETESGSVGAPSPPDSVTTEEDYSDARSSLTLSAASLPPSVEETETETEYLDVEKSSFPETELDSDAYLNQPSGPNGQMSRSEVQSPATPLKSSSPLTPQTPVVPEVSLSVPSLLATPDSSKLRTTLKDKILSITTPVTTSKESSTGLLQEEISKQPSPNGSKAGTVDKRELLFKILVIGELATGKTSIIKRYVHQFFSQHYRATIGVDFALKILNYDSQTIIRLQLWDIAGQERFGNMTRVYYKEAVGAFVVFDVSRVATFDAVVKWKQDLDTKVQLPDGNPIPCILLANKCDQQKEGAASNSSKMDEFCKEHKFAAWFETSAKDNINIEEAAKTLVTKILQNDSIHQNGRDASGEEKVALDSTSEKSAKSKCAC